MIEVPETCKIRDCQKEPVYHYHNPHSRAKGEFCAEHLDGLNPRVSIEYWLENGFAEPIEA